MTPMTDTKEIWDPPVPPDSDKKWPQHPAGAYPFILVDAFRIGQRVKEWSGEKKLEDRVVQIYLSGETDPDSGKPYELAVELTYSAGEKANLPKWLAKWLGKKAGTDEERGNLVAALPSYIGTSGIGTVVHNEVGEKTYVNLTAMAPLMKGMAPLTVPTNYTRNPYWAKKKARYAEDVAAYRKEQAAAKAAKPAPSFADVPPAVAEAEDDLPF
jgi:hypothetical protein